MKRITIRLDDDAYRRVHQRAAEQHTSVSALVRRHLVDLLDGQDAIVRLEKLERTLRGRIGAFQASDSVPRDDVHARPGRNRR